MTAERRLTVVTAVLAVALVAGIALAIRQNSRAKRECATRGGTWSVVGRSTRWIYVNKMVIPYEGDDYGCVGARMIRGSR